MEAYFALVKPPDETFSFSEHLDYSLVRPRAEDPAKLYLDSSSAKAVR